MDALTRLTSQQVLKITSCQGKRDVCARISSIKYLRIYIKPGSFGVKFHLQVGISQKLFVNFEFADTTEAGRLPPGASPYGALDMTGNVREWVNDW